jgi:hypothetical protein
MDAAKTLLPQRTIAFAEAAQLGPVISMPTDPSTTRTLTVEAVFLYGSGGTTVKAWVQTSLDNGVTWVDIMNFAFTTAAASKVSKTSLSAVLAAGVTPTDGTMADNTILDGLLGDRVRVKWTSTGTYAGATSLKVTAVLR